MRAAVIAALIGTLAAVGFFALRGVSHGAATSPGGDPTASPSEPFRVYITDRPPTGQNSPSESSP